jgi:hypothetical protein
MKKLNKQELKLANEWKDGMSEDAQLPMDQDIEFDVIGGFDEIPRVIYLRSLGYKFDNWEGYAWAEIDQMNKAA